jgi:hypothetical protein
MFQKRKYLNVPQIIEEGFAKTAGIPRRYVENFCEAFMRKRSAQIE